jgi:hypothetical protein
VTNERTLEVLLRIAEATGIHIARIEPSLVALSRAQASLRGGTGECCLIIQLDERGAELGIAHAGRLLLDYRPGGQTDATNIADLVAQHLTRLQRNVNRQRRDINVLIRQVYLAGDPAAVVRAAKQFARLKQFQVSVIDPAKLEAPWQFVGEPAGPELAAALGTALLEGHADAEKRSPNLLERILAESREPMRPILVRSLVPVAAVLLVAVGLFALFQRERIATDGVRAQLEELSAVRARARELQLTLVSADAKLAQLAALEAQLPTPNWSQLLARIAESMPEDVWLDSLSFRDGQTASLSGASYADGGVYDFVGYLKQVPDIAQIALEGTGVGHSPTGPTTSFDLELSLVETRNFNDREKSHD